MESRNLLRDSVLFNSNKIGKNISFYFLKLDNDEINNERIQTKINIRQCKINNIINRKRRIYDLDFGRTKRIEFEKNIKKLGDIAIPNDFQFKSYKYYESVVFL